jgi:hypothetical protein
MTETVPARQARLTDRWPTALALVVIAGVIVILAVLGRAAELFGPAVALMAGIYLMAYAIGRPWTAWVAFLVLSTVVSVLHVLAGLLDHSVDPGVGMTVVLVALWLWAVARHRYSDSPTFTIQTAGMVVFGAFTLVCAAVEPRLGAAVAGIGWLAHGAWDVYHFRRNSVVNRPWSEFCAVVDLGVGIALLVVAATT